MFNGASNFNQPIGNWDTGNVVTMSNMFRAAGRFNQPLENWDTGKVTAMDNMFRGAGQFNQAIGQWNTGNVTNMLEMFRAAGSFNQIIGSWNTSKVTNMAFMFNSAVSFNQDLSAWCVSLIPTAPASFDLSASAWVMPNSRPQWGTCPDPAFFASVSGPNEGWRMLGAPVAGATYGQLLSSIWTQGFPGSDQPSGAQTVYYFSEATGWANPDNASNIVGSNQNTGFDNAGHGIMVHFFSDDNFDGTPDPWPKVLSITGTPNSGTINRTLSRASEGWHLLSNPYPFTVSWSRIVADLTPGQIHGNIYVWDSNRSGGPGYRDTSDPADTENGWSGDIAPFQGFMVNTLVDGGIFQLQVAHERNEAGNAGMYNTQELVLARLRLSGDGKHASSSIIFDDEKALYPFSYNAYRMGSLVTDYLHLFTTNGADDTAWRVQHVPRNGTFTKELPLHVHTTTGGQFILEADMLQGLDGIEIRLADHYTGQNLLIEEGFSYSFSTDESEVLKSVNSNLEALMLTSKPTVKLDHGSPQSRFTLTINVNYTNTEVEEELPNIVQLGQNYPNPFNPTTQIQYALPEATNVRLEIFNVVGQRVATLVSGQQSAGQHSVSFDASNLASGVYVYRLMAGSFIETKKMLLIK